MFDMVNGVTGFVLGTIGGVVNFTIWVAQISLVVYVILKLVKAQESKPVRFLYNVCDIPLNPLRSLLKGLLSEKANSIFDWAPVVLFVLLGILSTVVGIIFW